MSISDVKKYFTIWAVHYLSGDKPVPVWRVSRYKHLPFCLWMQNYDCKIRDVKYSSKRAMSTSDSIETWIASRIVRGGVCSGRTRLGSGVPVDHTQFRGAEDGSSGSGGSGRCAPRPMCLTRSRASPKTPPDQWMPRAPFLLPKRKPCQN